MDGQALEHRDNNRFDYRHPLTCLIMGNLARPPEKVSLLARIMDISSGGLGIYVEKELTQGTVMLVRIPVSGTEANVPTLGGPVLWRGLDYLLIPVNKVRERAISETLCRLEHQTGDDCVPSISCLTLICCWPYNLTLIQSHYIENRELSPLHEYHNQQACPKTDEMAKDC